MRPPCVVCFFYNIVPMHDLLDIINKTYPFLVGLFVYAQVTEVGNSRVSIDKNFPYFDCCDFCFPRDTYQLLYSFPFFLKAISKEQDTSYQASQASPPQLDCFPDLKIHHRNQQSNSDSYHQTLLVHNLSQTFLRFHRK